MPNAPPRPWTADQCATVRALQLRHVNMDGIAGHLHRTPAEVDLCCWTRLHCSGDHAETARHLNGRINVGAYPDMPKWSMVKP